jgi:thiol:disulfide interchange protein DsbD
MGGSLLFTYALGMGVLFFAIAGFAIALPKSGRWMEAVKSIFGVVMVVAALYFLRNVSPALSRYGSAAAWWIGAHSALVAVGLALGAIHLSFHEKGARLVRKSAGVLAVVVGLYGGIGWWLTPKPLAWIHGEQAGVAAARASQKPALIDFYATWCIPCHELDDTFGKSEVMRELGRFALVKMDCSNDDDPVVKETTARYGAATLPTVVLLDSRGKVALKIDRVVGPDELLPLLQSVQ